VDGPDVTQPLAFTFFSLLARFLVSPAEAQAIVINLYGDNLQETTFPRPTVETFSSPRLTPTNPHTLLASIAPALIAL
jgi:hypothetical protein